MKLIKNLFQLIDVTFKFLIILANYAMLRLKEKKLSKNENCLDAKKLVVNCRHALDTNYLAQGPNLDVEHNKLSIYVNQRPI